MFRFLILGTAIAASSSLSLIAPSALAATYHYDAASGRCLDSDGDAGYNMVDRLALFTPDQGSTESQLRLSARDAECVDFTNFDFAAHIGMNYALLSGWNLRGAVLDGARFYFANIAGAALEGAKFSSLTYGYAEIEGTIDEHTEVSKLGCRPSAAGRVFCRL